MKHYLLTLAAALLLAAPATAQTAVKAQKASLAASRTNYKVGLKQISDAKFTPKQLPANSLPTFSQPVTRADVSGRSATELSYQVDGTEVNSASLIPTYLTQNYLTQYESMYGITGLGMVSWFTPDILRNYVGNTISNIHFALWMAQYTGLQAVILDAGTGATLWSSNVDSYQTWESSMNENVVDCDYQITGKETDGLMIGWICTDYAASSSDTYFSKYGVCVPYYPDYTSGGQGFYMLGIVPSTGEWYVLSNGGETEDEAGNTCYASAYVYCETTGSNGLPGNDLMAGGVYETRHDLSKGNDGSTVVAVLNEGINKVSSFDYTFEFDGKTKTGTCTLDEPISWYQAAYVELPVTFDVASGIYDNKFTVTKVNGEDDVYTGDNSASNKLFAMSDSYNRTPVVEEYTSTYCGWCPRGIVGLEKISEQYGDDAVIIAVHTDYGSTDPLTDDTYADAVDEYVSGLPTCVVNREYSGDPYYDVAEICEYAKQENCEANLVASAKLTKNMLGSNITVNAKVDFKLPVPENQYGLMFVLTEDDITGVNQLNYYNYYYEYYSSSYSDDVIYEQLFGIEDDEDLQALCHEGSSGYYQPTFNHVSVYTPDVTGSANLIPALEEGKTYETSVKLSLPTRSNPSIVTDNLKAAVMVVDLSSGIFVTGRQVSLTGEDSEPSAINDATADNAVISVADGAFNVKGENAKAEVFTLDGKLVSSCTVNGEASIPTFGKGTFIIRVQQGNNVTTQKAAF